MTLCLVFPEAGGNISTLISQRDVYAVGRHVQSVFCFSKNGKSMQNGYKSPTGIVDKLWSVLPLRQKYAF